MSRSRAKVCLACNREFVSAVEVCPDDGTALISMSAQSESPAESIPDNYRLVQKIGEGESALIYEAEHKPTGKRVAIKLLRYEAMHDAVLHRHILQEARLMARLQHPGIACIFDLGISDSRVPCLVLELIDGVTVRQHLEQAGRIHPKRACAVVSQVADALYHCHETGVVHAAMRPAEIIISGENDTVKIIDFGNAVQMPWFEDESAVAVNTDEFSFDVAYASPEQCLGKTLSPVSDVYSLGIVMYEMLAGVPPFFGGNLFEISQQHLSKEPPEFSELKPAVTDIPPAIEGVVRKMLRKSPDERFQNMHEVMEALNASNKG